MISRGCACSSVDTGERRGYFRAVPPEVASRLREIEPFLAMEVLERAFELEREGARILHLEVGEPDFEAPPAAIEACVRALREGRTHYTDSRGARPLRVASMRRSTTLPR